MMQGRSSASPIGLDIGRQSIKAVQWTGPRSAPRMTATAIIARTGEGAIPALDEAQRLGEILWRRGFHGRRAIVAIPEACALASVVEVPPASAGAPVAQIAAAELARLHGADPGDLETAYWPLPAAGPKGQRHEAVAVGVRRDAITALLDSLQARDGAGFEVVAADVGPCARVRAASLTPRQDDAWALLDIGWSSSRLCVVQRGLIIYDRALPDSGMAHLELRLGQECALKPEDIRHVLGQTPGTAPRRISGAWLNAITNYAGVVAAEAKDSLRFLALHRGIALPKTIALTGGGAESLPVVEQLSLAMDGACAPLSLNRHSPAPRPEGRAPNFSALSTALGLALWAA